MQTENLILPAALRLAGAVEKSRFTASAAWVRLPAGRRILGLRESPEFMAFPMAGSVRIGILSAEGRELTLYRVRAGEACVLTASCILGGARFPAVAEVEKEVTGWAVPAAAFHEWVARSAFWRQFVFRLLGERLAAVLAKLEETSFGRIDSRLARLLLAGGEEWAGTHDNLAADIGTAREVVSRTLARWRDAGWIESRRGRIKLLKLAPLRTLAAHA